jgi:hypothetical protein
MRRNEAATEKAVMTAFSVTAFAAAAAATDETMGTKGQLSYTTKLWGGWI